MVRPRPKPGAVEGEAAAGVLGMGGGMFCLLWLDSVHAEFRLIVRDLVFAWLHHNGMVVSSEVNVLQKCFCSRGGHHWPAVSVQPRGPGQPLVRSCSSLSHCEMKPILL